MFDSLINFDHQLLLLINGSHSLYADQLVHILTTSTTWIPLYVALFWLVLKNNENACRLFLVVSCAVVCILLAGTVDDMLVKPFVARYRPTHDPSIGILVDVVNGYRGGKYGFFSAHAANTFSLAVFFSLVVRKGSFTIMMICWSLVNCFTRIYLGVHYPGDIMAGLFWGGFIAWLIWLGYLCLQKLIGHNNKFVSSQYTRTGYRHADIEIVNTVLCLIYLYAFIRACV